MTMADGMNRVYLLGNLGADPELRHTQGGESVLNLRLATTESWFDKASNERKERTDWHNVVIWGRRAEALSQILSKGSTIFVEGSIRNDSYEDRQTGEKKYKTEIKAIDIKLFGGGNRDNGSQPQPQRRPAPQQRAPQRRPPPQQPQRGGYAPQGYHQTPPYVAYQEAPGDFNPEHYEEGGQFA